MNKFCSILLLLFLCSACVKRTPQPMRHLNEPVKVDSTLLAQIKMNQQMADAADMACIRYIKQDTLSWAQDSCGYWVCYLNRANGNRVQRGDAVTLRIRMQELEGGMLLDAQNSYKIGSDPMPQAVLESLLRMGYGDKMAILSPWYTAYGAEGNSIVPPYANIRIEIEVIM